MDMKTRIALAQLIKDVQELKDKVSALEALLNGNRPRKAPSRD